MALPVATEFAERHETAAPVGQKFDRMPVGRRNDRIAEPETVGERARGHLIRVEVRCHVDVAGGDIFEQHRTLDKLVVENDTIPYAEGARTRDKALAIAFALVADKVGMSGTQDDVDRSGRLTSTAGIASIITSMPLLGRGGRRSG